MSPQEKGKWAVTYDHPDSCKVDACLTAPYWIWGPEYARIAEAGQGQDLQGRLRVLRRRFEGHGPVRLHGRPDAAARASPTCRRRTSRRSRTPWPRCWPATFGRFDVFAGPIKDNTGKELLAGRREARAVRPRPVPARAPRGTSARPACTGGPTGSPSRCPSSARGSWRLEARERPLAAPMPDPAPGLARMTPNPRPCLALEARGIVKALPRRRRQRPRRLRPAPGRDPRAARRERRRQEHADEHPGRAVPAGCRRDPARRPAGRVRLAARRDRRRARHGPPALHAGAVADGHRERAARPRPSRASGFDLEADRKRRSASLAERFGLRVDPRAKIWQLSVGEQQRVEILKLLYRGARILIMDEPTAVLAPAGDRRPVPDAPLDGRRRPQRRVHQPQARRGDGHRRPDHGHAPRRRDGRGHRPGRRRRRRTWPGGWSAATCSRSSNAPRRRPGAVVLAVDDVTADNDRGLPALRGVSLEVRAGEIVGIAAVAGNGQGELAQVITGLRPCRGSVRIGGEEVANRPAGHAIRQGVAHVPEDRTGVGSSPNLSVADNLIMKRYRLPPLARGWFLDDTAARAPGPGAEGRVPHRGAVDRHGGAPPVGRQPAAAHLRPRDRLGTPVDGGRPADARARRRRDRGGPPGPARAARGGRRDRADLRGARRDPVAVRPGRRHVRGPDRGLVPVGDGRHPRDRPVDDRRPARLARTRRPGRRRPARARPHDAPPRATDRRTALVHGADDPRRPGLRLRPERVHHLAHRWRPDQVVRPHRRRRVRQRRRHQRHAGQGDAAHPDRPGLLARLPDAPLEHRGRGPVPAGCLGGERDRPRARCCRPGRRRSWSSR